MKIGLRMKCVQEFSSVLRYITYYFSCEIASVRESVINHAHFSGNKSIEEFMLSHYINNSDYH